MKIKRFNEYNSVNEDRRTELFGNKDRMPSNVISRQNQDFYDYYTRNKIRGKSKYELNREVFKMANGNDELATLAQFLLQIERESIAADQFIASKIKDLGDIKLDDTDMDLKNE